MRHIVHIIKEAVNRQCAIPTVQSRDRSTVSEVRDALPAKGGSNDMKRRLFLVVMIASFIPCLAATAMWILSESRVHRGVTWARAHGHACQLICSEGCLIVSMQWPWPIDQELTWIHSAEDPAGPSEAVPPFGNRSHWNRFGIYGFSAPGFAFKVNGQMIWTTPPLWGWHEIDPNNRPIAIRYSFTAIPLWRAVCVSILPPAGLIVLWGSRRYDTGFGAGETSVGSAAITSPPTSAASARNAGRRLCMSRERVHERRLFGLPGS